MNLDDKIISSKAIIAGVFLKEKKKEDFKIPLETFERNEISEDELCNIIAPTLKEEKFCEIVGFRDSLESDKPPRLDIFPNYNVDGRGNKILFTKKGQLEEFNKTLKEISKNIAYRFRAMEGLKKYVDNKNPVVRTLSSDDNLTVSFDEHTCAFMLGSKRISFTNELRKKIIRKLWKEKAIVDKKTKNMNKGGVIFSKGELATNIGFIGNPKEFEKDKPKKKEFEEALRGIKRQVKQSTGKIKLQIRSGIQLVVYE